MNNEIFDFRLGQEVFIAIRGQGVYVKTTITCENHIVAERGNKYRIRVDHFAYDEFFSDESFYEKFNNKICGFFVFDNVKGKSRQEIGKFYAKFISLDKEESKTSESAERAESIGEIEIQKF